MWITPGSPTAASVHEARRGHRIRLGLALAIASTGLAARSFSQEITEFPIPGGHQPVQILSPSLLSYARN